ncbi:MAG: metallophosphoesterase family protein, partial [Myxococcales bacterium]|nr:metallophosphoesterase family protein [Myxococcales bacterium]
MKRRIRVAHLSDLHVCHNLTTLANLFWDFVRLSGPPLSVRAALQRILDDPLRRDQLTRLLFRQKDAPEKLSPFKLLAWGVVSMPVAIYLIKQVLNFKRAFYISMDFPDRREVLLRHLEEQHVDHVVVSGDLSNAAHPRELGIAREFLDRLGGRERVSVIPGNHDVSMHNTVLSGISSVEEKLEDFLGSFRDYIPDQFPDPIAMEKTTLFPYLRLIDQSIALIGLDSTTYHPVLNVR